VNVTSYLLCAGIALFAGASMAGANTTILAHGHIYTGNPKEPWAQAIAFQDEKIVAIGSDSQVLRRWKSGAQVEDLKGRTVIPGIVDSHVHMLYGGYALHGLNLSEPDASITPDKPDVVVIKLREYAAAHPADAVLFARADFGTAPPNAPVARLPDEAVVDRPLIVHNTSEHALWVNSVALKMAGLGDYPVPDAIEEKGIVRDASGHPTGLLLEAGIYERPNDPADLVRIDCLCGDAAKFVDSPEHATVGDVGGAEPGAQRLNGGCRV
jgi:predicted amidohydrolase YtcJ